MRALMEKHGFKPYPPEWWHFSLKDEPLTGTGQRAPLIGPPPQLADKVR
jgi:hypothetical protein